MFLTHIFKYSLVKGIVGGNKKYVQIRKLRRLRLALSLLGNQRPNRRYGYGWPKSARRMHVLRAGYPERLSASLFNSFAPRVP